MDEGTTPRKTYGFQIGLFVLFALLALCRIYADWLWFDSLGYLDVYTLSLFSKIGLGAGIAIFTFAILFFNIHIASKRIKLAQKSAYVSLSFAFSILAGYIGSSFWFHLPRFTHASPFGFVDPLFTHDISFYMMQLPFLQFILALLTILTIACLAITFFIYLLSQNLKKTIKDTLADGSEIAASQIQLIFPKKGKEHLLALFGLLLLCVSAYFFLKRYSLLLSHRGAVYGAGFTDVHVVLPLYTLLSILALVAAFFSFTFFYHQKGKYVLISSLLILGVFFSGMIVSGMVQSFYVEPNELNLEEPYLKENIKHTLFAYKLTNVTTRDFPVSYDLTSDDIDKNRAMIDNIRLWDWRPLLTTYRQLQLFRTYYEFTDVDIDRYVIDGTLRQLMSSPRELDQDQLDAKAKTWVNQKFTYTHGYGAVSSPVNVISGEGLPELLIQDIPPKTDHAVLALTEPRIYFGEKTNSFAIVNTKTKEFDYPLGNENVFASYNGSDGIVLDSLLKKFIFSVKLGSINLMVSSGMTPQSKVLIKRNIMERVRTLAPFLEYDEDPYIVIDNGKMYWMIDAYTYSNRFPYSENTYWLNYVRNSVKVVVDAYEGSVTFYVIDTDDPLIKNYWAIYPSLFKPFSDMPKSLQAHIRYPEDLFRIQTQIFGTYHMKESQVFYNKEDVWQTPKEIYDRDTVDMSPYYIILRLPGESKEGFFLITPLIPRGKDNMIAWLSARSDPTNYGTLEVFKLSKQELTYGPMQIEARINQDTDIAQLFTLWSQQGSQVIRGNMIVIPIENSFLYIEPVYLKASSQGALPQLKRVVVAYEDKLTMEESLDEALSVLFGSASPKKESSSSSGPTEGKSNQEMSLAEKFSRASVLYNEAEKALSSGDFSLYAEKIEEMGSVLNS